MNLDPDLIEEIAMAIYCDSFTQYGTCTPHRWKQTSEPQREFHRSQARIVITKMMEKGWKSTSP